MTDISKFNTDAEVKATRKALDKRLDAYMQAFAGNRTPEGYPYIALLRELADKSNPPEKVDAAIRIALGDALISVFDNPDKVAFDIPVMFENTMVKLQDMQSMQHRHQIEVEYKKQKRLSGAGII